MNCLFARPVEDANEFEVILGTNKSEEFKVFKLKELLPLGFGPKNLAE